MFSRRNDALTLVFGINGLSRPLGSYSCDAWTLAQSVVDNEESCAADTEGSQPYLLFEFWRLDRDGNIDKRNTEDVYFLVARGKQPSVVYTNNDVLYTPTRAANPQLGQNGTMLDADALSYWRPYHRVIVPANASVSYNGSKAGSNNWYVTVGNMDSSNTLSRYSIRVSCVAYASAPCPSPLPDMPECAGQGQCVAPPATVNSSALNRVCVCSPGYGDYGCQASAPALDNGVALSAVVTPGAWAVWQLRVPLPQGTNPMYKPSLLVELSRDSSDASAFGGDPILVVVPKDADGSNRVPWFSDLTRYADLRSYFLQQNFHYLLSRDLVAAPAYGDLAADSVADYYVAVFNNDQRFVRDTSLLHPRANVTIKARWRTGATGSPLCPGDCFGRGICYNPWDIASRSSLPLPILQPVSPNSGKPLDFQCACKPDYGGTMCEGQLRNLSVTTSGDGVISTLSPGQWYFAVLYIDARRFDYKSDNVAIQWNVRDNPLTADPATSYVNPYLTIDEHAFPRDAQLDRGWQLFYYKLVGSSNPPQPIQIKGSDLEPGLQYVLGVYNSDYVRSHAFAFSLSVYVPSTSRTWLHPYMSVVLGVTASIILCLLLTLCRRVVQRYGWGPFRPRADPMLEGGGRPVQVLSLAPRNLGVPSHVIEAFPAYQYTATKAEKAQLARSRRDHDAVLQHQGSSTRRASDGGGAGGGGGGGGGAPQLEAVGEDGPLKPGRGDEQPAAAAGAGAAAASPSLVAMAAAAAAAPSPATVVVQPHQHHEHGGGNQLAVGGGGGCGAAAGDDDDEPQCAVCLCEYEEGERIIQLPCKHEFHSTCINKWLQTHSTCPICRISLLPPSEEGEADAEGEQQQQQLYPPQGQPTAGGAPPPPPAPPPPHGAIFIPVAPPPPGAAVAPPPQAQAGLMSRVLGSLRRTGSSAQVSQLPPPPPQQQQQMAVRRPDSAALGPAAPAPALLAPAPYGVGALVASVPEGAPQLLAVGPSVMLEAPSGGGAAGGSGGGSVGHGSVGRSPSSARGGASSRGSSRSPGSPAPLAAGRRGGSPPTTPVPLGGGGGGEGGAGAASPPPRPARDGAALPRQLEMGEAEEAEAPELPGVSSSPSPPRQRAGSAASRQGLTRP